MIKINLLPVRAAKKRETAKQQIAIFVGSLVLVLAVAATTYALTIGKIKATKDEISRSQAELQSLKTKIGEIENIKKLQAEVKKKLEVLNQLRKERTGPANRLTALSAASPEKLWLTKYSEKDTSVAIGGVAFSEDLIAQFMRNLQESTEFGNVELVVSEQSDVAGVKAKKFDLTSVLKNKKEEKKAEPAKK